MPRRFMKEFPGKDRSTVGKMAAGIPGGAEKRKLEIVS